MDLVTSPRRRLCEQCQLVELTGRADQRTCGKVCRQARARYRKAIHSAGRALVPLTIAYGDPPYPGKAGLYIDHPDFAGEVDFAALLARLQRYDGWALSVDEEGLRIIRPLLDGIDYRIAVWVRGARPGVCRGPAATWEAVIYRPARTEPSRTPALDSLVFTSRPRTTNPHRVIGAKPAAFWSWLFKLLDARPGDHFDDLFPGSNAGELAWRTYTEKAA